MRREYRTVRPGGSLSKEVVTAAEQLAEAIKVGHARVRPGVGEPLARHALVVVRRGSREPPRQEPSSVGTSRSADGPAARIAAAGSRLSMWCSRDSFDRFRLVR